LEIRNIDFGAGRSFADEDGILIMLLRKVLEHSEELENKEIRNSLFRPLAYSHSYQSL